MISPVLSISSIKNLLFEMIGDFCISFSENFVKENEPTRMKHGGSLERLGDIVITIRESVLMRNSLRRLDIHVGT
jgi:hypothetical protein